MVESWTAVHIEANHPFDPALYSELLDPLAHDQFRGDYSTWHFFWEPEGLLVRFHWIDPDAKAVLELRLNSYLDGCRDEGRFARWEAGAPYEGEASDYGPEVWDLIERDWMNSAELVVRVRVLDASGKLTGKPGFGSTPRDHWSRHVHLYTNPLFGSWDAEVELCLAQANGYLVHLHATNQAKYAQALSHVTAAIASLY